MQTPTCRLIAGVTFCLGLIPLLLMVNAEARTLPHLLSAVAITVCCTVVAGMWLRRCWPSRAQSRLAVVIGSACITLACLIQADPLVGLLGCTAFLVPTVFIGFFHSARLLALAWTVAAATLILLAVRMVPVNTTLAVSAVVLVAVINVFTGFACIMVLRLIDLQVRYSDIEPLTGLLTRAGFYEKVATLIGARSRHDDRYLVIAVVNLDSFSLLLSLAGAAGARRARIAIAQRLRETVRRHALIAHISDAEFLIAELFTTPDPSALIERVRGTITNPPFPLTASIGAVSTPLRPLAPHSSHDVLDEVLTIATSAMYEARRAGGNQARHVLNPTLTVLDEPTTGDQPNIA
jgi:GGDEF domain-containing protein